MRRDITIAKVSWNIIDVVKVFLIVIILPLIVFGVIIVLSRTGVLPEFVRQTLRNNSEAVGMIYAVLALVSEITAIIWLVKKYSLSLSDLGFRKFNTFKALGYILISLVFFSAILVLVFWFIKIFVPSIDLNQAQKNGFEFGKAGVGLWLSFIITVVITPVIEEIFFRGITLPATIKKWGWLAGIVSTSLLFGVLHAQANVIIYTFILGLILSVFYIRLKSIVPGIILHAINNAIAFAVLAGLIK
jgi:membrane protease YdiL (CAAX protease family)